MIHREPPTKTTGVLRFCLLFLVVAVSACSLTAAPVTAQETTPSVHEYDGTELLLDGEITTSGGVATLALGGTAQEGDSVLIELDEDSDAFEIASATDATDEAIGIDLTVSGDTIEITITDLGGDGTLDDTAIAVEVDLTASDEIAGDADIYSSTPVATVVSDETESGLVGESAIAVSVNGAAEIGFDADFIDDEADYPPIWNYDMFTLGFADDSVLVDDGDTINLSVDSEVIDPVDEEEISVGAVWVEAIQDGNISSVEISTSSDANVLDGNPDQITITIHTDNGGLKIVSGEAISIGVELELKTESMKSAADRYRDVDFFTVGVEGEDNAELTDNDDIKTESPVIFDIYPGEANAEGFDLGKIESGDEFGVSENRTLATDSLEDRFGNEIREAEFEVTIEDSLGTRVYDDVWMATNGSANMTLGAGGDFDVPLGAFDVSGEVTNVSGPATQSENTGEDVTETATELVQYPDNVTFRTTPPYNDFDLGSTGDIEVEVDLDVADEDIGRVDLQLRRENGAGDVTFDTTGGSPTATDLWEDTGFGGDGHLGEENPWAIERGLTSADFDDGVRRYVLDADTADSYEISVAVMPHDPSVVPDTSELETSLADDPGGRNRDTTGITATGEIAAVSNVSVRTDQEFVGIDVDEGKDIEIDLSGFEDPNGNAVTNTDKAVSVKFGNAHVADVSPTDGDDSFRLSADQTAIDSTEIDTGTKANVTVEFEDGSQRNGTDIMMVHRAIERSENAWRVGSIPQPATLYVDASGQRDFAHWDAENETYESLALDASGDTLESYHVCHEHLHRGFYAYSGGSTLRIGFEYTTDATESIGTGEIELEDGWHLASSNFNVSAYSQRDLDDDLRWAETDFSDAGDSFSVWDRYLNRLHPTSEGVSTQESPPSVEHDDVYWINVNESDESPLVRVINSPIFAEGDGVQE